MKKISKKSRSSGEQSKPSHLTLVGYVRRNLQAFVIEQGMLALQGVLREVRLSLGNALLSSLMLDAVEFNRPG